ncbi:hypothetical protein [Roseobacter sp. S98]|uniref:hypothetical protein n=1 Tax=Roseobacter algicola (ex Choi et al. 2025) (nom. illeg.) TaxID=3092138 RepID=UPI003F518769
MPEKDHDILPSAQDPDSLVATYGGLLSADETGLHTGLIMQALWLAMAEFVDLGLNIAPGEKFHKNSDVGMDNVVNYICREETAPETVAPPKHPNRKEP